MTGALARRPPADGPPRVFCFHHAGGGASAFAAWPRLLAADAHVCAVQLPGREGRAIEPRQTGLEPLARELAAELLPWVDASSVFYGQSMGALLSFAVARELAGRGADGPGALIAAAFPAPHLPPPFADRGDALGTAELVSLATEIGGLHPALLRERRWLEAFLPILRDDILLCRGYGYESAPPLRCRIVALAGTDDPLVGADDVAAWAQHSSAGFELELVRGGHFFFKHAPAAVTSVVARVARALAPRAEPSVW